MDAPTNKPDNPDEVSSSKVHDHDVPVSMTEEKRDTAEHTRPPPLTEDELALEKKLRRKIDLRIMPLIIWTYLMNYIDRLVVYFPRSFPRPHADLVQKQLRCRPTSGP